MSETININMFGCMDFTVLNIKWPVKCRHTQYIIFNIYRIEGNREIIYETGDGYTLLADSTKWNFNYVNVWRLQKDGEYKLEIDTYTPLDIVE